MKLALALFCLIPAVLCWDSAHVTADFFCSVGKMWIPSSTHLKFWDNGRIWDNVISEFDLPDGNTTIDVNISNGIYGLRPMVTITHYCNKNNLQITHKESLHLGDNYLGRYDLANAK